MSPKVAILFSSKVAILFVLSLCSFGQAALREYFIAVEEVDWNYAPSFPDLNVGDTWLKRSNDRIGSQYKKAQYIEYTDITFQTKKPVPLIWKHKHLLGPVIRAQVGDMITVIFKNKCTIFQGNYTIHPHGVKYGKMSEGAFLHGVTPPGGVPPGGVHTYSWEVTERAGPSEDDPSSIIWLYHSHSDEVMDTNSGLVGPMIISRKNQDINNYGMPTDIDREIILFFSVLDEGQSHYLQHNINQYANGSDANDADFQESNLMHSVNGRVFNNVESMNMAVGENVRWYLMALGTEVDIHTIHWHALTMSYAYTQTDVISLLPASMVTVDSSIDSSGDWFVHCHVNDHIVAGMLAQYQVNGTISTPIVTGTTHEYYIAVEERTWDYAPIKPLAGVGDIFLKNTNSSIGSSYKKALYIEYTDENFDTVKAVPAEWVHKGILGPIIRAQVGDKIRVHFKNNAQQMKYSMHPHGVFYSAHNEGAWIRGISPIVGGVEPNHTFTYEWYVPERAGPSKDDGSSICWLYHSHVDETMDTNSGLVGVMIISRKSEKLSTQYNGMPDDIDREFVLFFTVMDENQVHYLSDNIATYTNGAIETGNNPDFEESNLMHCVNGYIFNNVPNMTMAVGNKVRWYIVALGTEVDLHTIHFHALTLSYKRSHTDVIPLLPAMMATVDTEIDSVGTWFVHCHVNDHIKAGMLAEYTVTGESISPAVPLTTHRYYIAADEVNWNYAPIMPLDNAGDTWLTSDSNQANIRIGKIYKKARYVEYTNENFTTVKRTSSEWEHKGILGPILRAQVGDLIEVHFRNNASQNYSMHPHGVFYEKALEGPWIPGITPPGGVMPGETHIYRWYANERAGPTDYDPSSIVWMYHSHVDEVADTNAGLVGAIIVSRSGTPIDSMGKPTEIDREFIMFYTVLNENESPYLQDNINMAGTPNVGIPALEADPDFQESNLMHAVNGLLFNNVVGMTMVANEKVRWYLMALGTEVDLHTVHWHALTTVYHGRRTDVVELLPASMATVDSVPDSVGTWFVHCHVNDHISAGMGASFTIQNAAPTGAPTEAPTIVTSGGIEVSLPSLGPLFFCGAIFFSVVWMDQRVE